ncbi:phytoene/squalene synthase family protein [Leucobacter massiliensis]|uniref:Phytoene synthase n=1 Tax=Leucobacter massiliensis TaxID=1686285 RepID=A0A2S9QP44_9MICO|nr:squalene/phytoene synthase family protein [Leucobacter massiliensis]PRI11356.1 hypothetical protein B4915_09020 [Leucobacter massiliensis]
MPAPRAVAAQAGARGVLRWAGRAAGAGSAGAGSAAATAAGSPGAAEAPAVERDADGLLVFGDEAHAAYVYGSAEVVGLMCLRVFTADGGYTQGELERLEHGARRLGAAFQNVNFLRDLADDTERLGRSYLGQRATVDEALQARWVATIREQLADAADALPLLPRDARVAVGCALRFFSTLTDRIAAVPAATLHERRIRVPGPQKTWLIARSVLGAQKGGRT